MGKALLNKNFYFYFYWFFTFPRSFDASGFLAFFAK